MLTESEINWLVEYLRAIGVINSKTQVHFLNDKDQVYHTFGLSSVNSIGKIKSQNQHDLTVQTLYIKTKSLVPDLSVRTYNRVQVLLCDTTHTASAIMPTAIEQMIPQGDSFILMNSSKDIPALHKFVRTTLILLELGLKTASILHNLEDLNNQNSPLLSSGILALQDLGDIKLKDYLSYANTSLQCTAYAVIVRALVDLQRKTKKVADTLLEIPKHSAEIFVSQASRIIWYIQNDTKVYGQDIDDLNDKLQTEMRTLWEQLRIKDKCLMLRDLHSENIMLKGLGSTSDESCVITSDMVYFIDHQDAMIGTPIYDLASLIDDNRIDLSPHVRLKTLELFCQNSRLDLLDVQNDYAIIGLQRNMRILGILSRIMEKTAKTNECNFKYRAMISRTKHYLRQHLIHDINKPIRLLFEHYNVLFD